MKTEDDMVDEGNTTKSDKSMTKFKVLKYNQIFMAKLGIHSYDLTVPKNEFFRSPAALCIVSILCIFSITSTGCYAFKNIEKFDTALQAIFVLIAGIQCLGMYVTVGLKKRQVKDVQLKLEHMVDEGMFSTEKYFK